MQGIAARLLNFHCDPLQPSKKKKGIYFYFQYIFQQKKMKKENKIKTRNEKRETRSKKRKAKSEKRKAKSEKLKVKSEKQNTKNEKQKNEK
jgi:hypothetical protein